jgi:hypothetical protein
MAELNLPEDVGESPAPEKGSSRPDPVFKLITSEEAKTLGLIVKQTEIQYSTRTDLILTVPEGVSTVNTMFDFFRGANLVEFKSENDPLTLEEYIRNEVRTGIWFLQTGAKNYNGILNAYVVARKPGSFFKVAETRGITFVNTKERKWLWTAKVGFQDVAVVVCNNLPLDKRYYKWLLFAPAKSGKWKQFIQRLVDERNKELLEIAIQMRPKEIGMVTSEEVLKEIMAELSPEEKEVYEKEVDEGYELMITALAKKPEKLAETLAKLPEGVRNQVLAKLRSLLGNLN